MNPSANFWNMPKRFSLRSRGVRYWITFNEPYVLLLGGYLEGCMPPGVSDASLALKALENILICHGKTFDMIHAKVPGR